MRKRLLALPLAVLLSGCMIGPDYFRPFFDTPPAWRVTDTQAKDLANTAWWEQFGDPVLNDLIAAALRENRDLMIATARIDEFAGFYGVSRSALFPQFGVGVDASKQRLSIAGSANNNDNQTFNSYSALINASWEIDLWGKIRRQNESARAQLLASEESRQGVILSLVGTVAASYVNLRDLDRQLEISIDTANSRRESYQVFKDRYEGGVISLLELNQNKSQYEEALATIPALEKAIAQQENAIAFLLGRNPQAIARGKPIGALIPPAIPEGLPSTLLERRPDLRVAEQNLIAANALIGAAKAEYYPTISLTGLFGVASGSLSNLWSSGSRAWQYAGGVGMPIFTAGRLSGQVEVANAQQQQALFGYQKAVQNAFREVNDALIDQDRTNVQLAAQGRQVEALVIYADTARLRYDNGYTSYIEVLDAERSLFNAQLQYTQTQQVRLQAMISLYKAMGGGWVGEADKLTVAVEKT